LALANPQFLFKVADRTPPRYLGEILYYLYKSFPNISQLIISLATRRATEHETSQDSDNEGDEVDNESVPIRR
jgi:hypothetical protein